MKTKQLALKLDVDTLRGYRQGVPRLLGLFERKGISCSIFFSMGPDNSGKAIRRIFRKGFASKMIRTRAPSTYGIKTLLYGTLLPAPMIVQSAPDILLRACESHDCGIHAWDHVKMQDELPAMTRGQIRGEYAKAFDLFEAVTGKKALSSAAPGWQTSADCFTVEDELGLEYASDCRGKSPFYPEIAGVVYRTLHIPTTLPTMDELALAPGEAASVWLADMRQETEVLTIHAEMEGMARLPDFEKFIDTAAERGVRFVTLRDLAAQAAAGALVAGVRCAPVKGRAGVVAWQVPYTDDDAPGAANNKACRRPGA